MLETSIAIGLVTAIVQAIKVAFKIPRRFVFLLSLVVAIIYAIIFREQNDLITAIFIGLLIGSSASGLYAGTKASING